MCNVLANARTFADLTGVGAEIDPQCGGRFAFFDYMIIGLIIEKDPDNRLAQALRVPNCEPGVYSIVRFELKQISTTGSRLISDHFGFPQGHRQHLEQGWHTKYWQPMKHYLHHLD